MNNPPVSLLVAVICFWGSVVVQALASSADKLKKTAKPGSCVNFSMPSQFNNTYLKMFNNLQHICTWNGTHIDSDDDYKGRVHLSGGCLSNKDCFISLCNVSEKDSGTYYLYVQLDPNSPTFTHVPPVELSVQEEKLKPTVLRNISTLRNISHNATRPAGLSTPLMNNSHNSTGHVGSSTSYYIAGSVFLGIVICVIILGLVGYCVYRKRNKNKAGKGSSSSVEEQSYQNLLKKAGEGNTDSVV